MMLCGSRDRIRLLYMRCELRNRKHIKIMIKKKKKKVSREKKKKDDEDVGNARSTCFFFGGVVDEIDQGSISINFQMEEMVFWF